MSIKDITGQQFGSLTALELSHVGHNNTAHWKYRCVCGNIHVARGNIISLAAKKSPKPQFPSCGCKELEQKTKHGYRKIKDTHPLYKLWRGMLERCYGNPTSKAATWYQNRGVTMCEEWKENPVAFIEWGLANGWKKGLHIDKDILSKQLGISPSIYSPLTCQFVTAKENVGFATNRNNYGKHSNVRLSHDDVATILAEYRTGISGPKLAAKYGVGNSSIYRLIRLDAQATA